MTDPLNFFPGCIVRLKSGGVPMTVGKVGGTSHSGWWALVQWFDGATLRAADFDLRQIEIVPEIEEPK